jgi:hypothetical protein
LRRRHAIGAGANQGGRHLLIRSFHVGDRFFAKNWSEAERQAFLDWAQGQGYNTLSIASHLSSGFSGSLNLADRAQGRHDIIKKVWDFFETIQFYRLSPRQDLVTNGFCLAEEGREYLVYLDSGGSVSVKLKPGRYAVRYQLQELDDLRAVPVSVVIVARHNRPNCHRWASGRNPRLRFHFSPQVGVACPKVAWRTSLTSRAKSNQATLAQPRNCQLSTTDYQLFFFLILASKSS